jgi:hypothetical protein
MSVLGPQPTAAAKSFARRVGMSPCRQRRLAALGLERSWSAEERVVSAAGAVNNRIAPTVSIAAAPSAATSGDQRLTNLMGDLPCPNRRLQCYRRDRVGRRPLPAELLNSRHRATIWSAGVSARPPAVCREPGARDRGSGSRERADRRAARATAARREDPAVRRISRSHSPWAAVV